MDYNFYIDEAGDEGIDRGTQWFLIGGILARKADDLEVSRCVDKVKAAIKQRDLRKALHWKELARAHPKRLHIIREFGQLPVDLLVCAMHKPSILESRSSVRSNGYTTMSPAICWSGSVGWCGIKPKAKATRI